ncbi:chromosome segregation protein SMC [Chloroflexus sp.]|uniref:chromosome segregation protein SMC n=1 Tax=Chloroflexus sp. TaxID=1904827 RepID=UPI00298F076B|nr:chromosome segregation protein SMC [Chloroflexus sp.]MDW8405486.1 chromosome segregation protein SMC [Chloroflexus sp.]
MATRYESERATATTPLRLGQMYLKRLEIQGFKTFASRTVFEFQPGITAVVGPNGSGKSNLADAVRWVLGEQSMAALRCKQAAELLFAGGGRRPPAGLAEVALTIDNTDRLLPLDFDEVTITRRVTRAGENEYFINRARVRLRDLLATVEPLGGSYTIINQGLVDAALTLRPAERRRLFEDAAEIGGFELRKAEALRRLRESEANLQRVSDLLAELEPRLRALRRQAGQARQYREWQAELQTLLAHWHYAQWHEAQAQAEQAQAQAQQADDELARQRAKQAEAAAAVQAQRAALRERREALSVLHHQAAALHQQAEALQRELAVENERIAAAARRSDELERQMAALAEQQQSARQERDRVAAELAQVGQEVATARHDLALAEREQQAGAQARAGLNAELKAAQERALQAARAEATTASRIEQIVAQQDRLRAESERLAATLAQAAGATSAAQAAVAEAQTALVAAEQAYQASAAAVQTARQELDRLRAARAAADEERATCRHKLAEREARLEALTRLARSHAGAFAGVKAALEWAERSGRTGFTLVQQIVRVPAELETAIEVALGARLQHIVVEQWRDAEEAIAELRRTGAGRATFLPLDTLRRPSDARRPAFSAQVIGVAAELVEYDPRYAVVVEQLLGRVLVVADLATARAELRHLPPGWTIVTLAGEQVQSGGAVTGGAPTRESGALRRERELRELPEQVAAARAALEAVDRQRAALDQALQAATASLRSAEQAERDAQRRREAARNALDQAQRRARQIEQEQQWVTAQQERLARELATLAEQVSTLRERQANLRDERAAADAALAALRERQEQQSNTDRAAQEQLANLRATLSAAESRQRMLAELLAGHERTLANLARQQSELETSLHTLHDERAQREAAYADALARQQQLLAELNDLRGQIEPAEAELAAAEAELAQLEAAEAQATTELLAAEANHSRLAREAQRAADRLETLFERAVADGIDLTAPPPAGNSPPLAELPAAIEALRARIVRLGVVNPLALEEYEEANNRYAFLTAQADDLRAASATLHQLIDELDGAMNDRFQHTFQAVAAEFSATFQELFGGGSARLELIETDPDSNEGNGKRPLPGVEIIARPPGKRPQNIALLSGGERTLTAVALLFAILKVNPSPFCILDETDAALDESNIGRFRAMLQRLTDRTQFIVITHNRGTIEVADTLYGVSMGDDGASRVVSLRVEEYVGAEP